jgi:hypothetical protein
MAVVSDSQFRLEIRYYVDAGLKIFEIADGCRNIEYTAACIVHAG